MTAPTTAPLPPPSHEEIRRQLQAILASAPFANAARSRRFLSHIVDQTLAGRTDGIKELVLGIEVFDRAGDFDPKIDTIVRVEAGKLRKRLDEYYANEGASAPLLIEVPKGSYIPQFQLRSLPAAPDAPTKRAPAKRAPVLLTLLALAAGVWWGVVHFRAPAPAIAPSIAVLPFLNLSTDPANEYFAEGLSEELTDALCNAGGLRVASRTSAFFFKGKSADIREIGQKLHVAFVVEGSVRKQGDQLKVTAQLIRADDGYHLWSGSFERRLSDVFAVQREISSSLVSALQLKLTAPQTRRLKKAHTANQEAFDLYLRGKHFETSFQPGDLDRAEALFQKSIAIDPAYALSYTALAAVYLQQNLYGNVPANVLVSKANAAVQKALSLDNELAEAYVILGTLAARHYYDGGAADRHLRHALELNPSSAMAHYQLAQTVMAPRERWQEAAAESRLASELDPLSPMIAMSEPWLAFLERRHDAAVAGFQRLADANPLDVMAIGGLSFALRGKQDFPAALRAQERLQQLAPSTQSLGFSALLHALMGQPAEARKLLQQLLEISRTRFVAPDLLAVPYLGLGESGEAFRYTEIARQEQESSLIYLRLDSMWDPYRKDPRFLKLLEEVGLSDAQIAKNQQVISSGHR